MQLSVTSPLSLEETGTLSLSKRGLDTAGGITDFKFVATPGVKWCHVLQRADFEAKPSPNLVPRGETCGHIWATFLRAH